MEPLVLLAWSDVAGRRSRPGRRGAEGDLHSLFPVSGNQGAVAVQGYVDDAEPNLRLRDAGPAVSRPAHLGSCVAWGGASRRG